MGIMTHDRMGVEGYWNIQVIDATKFASNDSIEDWIRSFPHSQPQYHPWVLSSQARRKNKIVDTGLAYLGLMVKGSAAVPTDVGVGTDATSPVAGDTALGTQVFADAITQRLNLTAGVRIRFLLPTTAANGSSLVEAGIIGPSPDLRLLSRVTHGAIAKSSTVAINYTWDLTFAEVP